MDEEFVEPEMPMQLKKSGGFESMGLIPPVYHAIKKKGYSVPTPIQRKAIPLIVSGQDLIACSKTGSGKTAAFVIPLISRLKEHSTTVGVRCLIILPTRELALQTSSTIKHFAKETNLIHSILVGGHGFEGQFESLAQNPDILIATPGRLLQHLTEGRFSLSRVEMVIYDEADYLFELGLADQLKSIVSYLPSSRQSMIFSATIPEQLSIFAQVGLRDYRYVKLDREYSLPDNMLVNFLIVGSDQKLSALIFLLQRFADTEQSIIFASTKYLVDLIVYTLERVGIQAVSVYGKMDQYDRREQLQQFRNRNCKILVVTDLASRGIDIPYVSNVIHFDYPASSKIFIHRSGRTARAGKKGTVYTLLAHDELYYIHETMLFAGRKLVSQGDLEDSSLAIYGQVPVQCISVWQEKINYLLAEDPDFTKLLTVSKRADIKFKKTRGQASRASIKNARTIDSKAIHPMFADDVKMDEDTTEMLRAIKEYKPTQSCIEIKRIQALRAGDEAKSSDPLLKAINDLKVIQHKAFQKKENRDKLAKQLQADAAAAAEEAEDEQTFTPTTRKSMPQMQQRSISANKKSMQTDFRHPTQFMTSRFDPSHSHAFDDLHKIQASDINSFIIGEDMDDLKSANRKYVWDKVKKKYTLNAANSKTFEDQKKGREYNSETTFVKWKKNTHINIQKVGEREDQQMTSQAKNLFQRRKMRAQGYHFDEKKQPHARNELKTQQQLVKSKKIKKNLNLKNMEKGKRRQIENKTRMIKKQRGAKR